MTRLKKRVINWCLKHLVQYITDKDVVPFAKLSNADKDMLSLNAATLKQLPLWTRLLDDMENSARQLLFLKSQNEFDMIHAKSALYVVNLMRIKVDQLYLATKATTRPKK